MKIIFDYDHTLINVKKLKVDLAGAMGVSLEDFSETYNGRFKNNSSHKVDYDPVEHYRTLARMKKITIDENEINSKIEKVLQNADKYLKTGALELLKLFQERKDELFLITFGNKKWQEKKVNGTSSLEPFFDEAHKKYADKDKIESIGFLKETDEVILIINDNLAEGLKMKEFLGEKCKLLIIEGDYSEETEKTREQQIDYEKFKNFSEITKKYFPNYYNEQIAETENHLK